MMKVALTKLERMPKMRLWPASFLKMCHSVRNELSKIRTGRKIARIPVGLAELINFMDSPNTPNFG